LIRGITVTESYQLLLGRKLSEEEYFRAAILGWCIEWVITDHYSIDQSFTQQTAASLLLGIG